MPREWFVSKAWLASSRNAIIPRMRPPWLEPSGRPSVAGHGPDGLLKVRHPWCVMSNGTVNFTLNQLFTLHRTLSHCHMFVCTEMTQDYRHWAWSRRQEEGTQSSQSNQRKVGICLLYSVFLCSLGVCLVASPPGANVQSRSVLVCNLAIVVRLTIGCVLSWIHFK